MVSVAVEGGEGGLIRCHEASGYILVQKARHSIVFMYPPQILQSMILSIIFSFIIFFFILKV
jgi:hypothetical protein